MPVARIYASLVEEAEPICADLLARGYNVEVVFPDAVLPTPADLELRVERCSPEEAIARVEAGGSPSRCVFVTPAKGPRRELLLVEMTVLATGTDARHPIAMPGMALVSGNLAVAPLISWRTETARPSSGEVVPFPASALEAPDSVTPVASLTTPQIANDPVETVAGIVAKTEQIRSRRRQSDQDLSKDLIAELNVFLANAPIVERPEGLYVRIFENVRNSAGAERARKNWESLTLAGVAASLLALIALGWNAAPDRVRRSAVAPHRMAAAQVGGKAESVAFAKSTLFRPQLSKGSGLASAMPVALETQVPTAPLQLASAKRRIGSQISPAQHTQDDVIAEDHVSRVSPPAKKFSSDKLSKTAPKRFFSDMLSKAAPTTTSELVPPKRPSAQSPVEKPKSAPIKIITDLR